VQAGGRRRKGYSADSLAPSSGSNAPRHNRPSIPVEIVLTLPSAIPTLISPRSNP